MQPTSFTLKIFLTPSKNPESTRIEIKKIPVSLTIHEKQRMKKFCANVCPFSSKKVLRLVIKSQSKNENGQNIRLRLVFTYYNNGMSFI